MFQDLIESLYTKKPGAQGLAWDLAWKLGFPSRKVESYRKVPLQTVSKFMFEHKGQAVLDTAHVPKPIVVLSIEEAKKTYGLFLENRAKQRASREKDFFAALTDALYEQGFFIYVPPGTVVKEPIPITLQCQGALSHFASHVQIFVGKGAEVQFHVVPQMDGGMLTQLVDIYLDKESRCGWVDEANVPNHVIYINSVRASLKRSSKLQVWGVSKGSTFFRQDFCVELLEEESEAILKGAAKLSGKNVSHTQVLIEHKAPCARSNQHFKAVMKDQSSSTFEGKIFVQPEAQKTEAYQLNNNLLLGKESSVFSKPNLEIFADDVKASHGSTVSNLSEEELFYFRTRGISKEMAGNYLASGFLDEIIKDIPSWHLIRNG